MFTINNCELCNRKNVPLRLSSENAVIGLSFAGIIEMIYNFNDEDLHICFKCQENAIIAYEFHELVSKYLQKAKEKKTINEQEEAASGNDNFFEIIEYDEQGNEEESYESEKDETQLNEFTVYDSDDIGMNDEFSQLDGFGEIEQIEEMESNEVESESVEQLEQEPEEEELIEIPANNQFHCKCGKFLTGWDNYRRHLLRHQRSKEEKLNCRYCPRQFVFARDLNFHEKKHEQPKELHTCEICNKLYSSKDALKKHMPLHTDGSKTFKCNFQGCNASFSRKFTLQNHMLTHDASNKPFACQHEGCDESFFQKTTLQNHLKKVHGQKYFYECEGCQSGFVKKVELKNHWLECQKFLKSRK